MKINPISSEQAWTLVSNHINRQACFHSITGISYDAEIKNDVISYIGGKGNRGTAGESISKIDFVQAFEKTKHLPELNTNSIKEVLPASMYRKRTPFIGLLKSALIIE